MRKAEIADGDISTLSVFEIDDMIAALNQRRSALSAGRIERPGGCVDTGCSCLYLDVLDFCCVGEADKEAFRLCIIAGNDKDYLMLNQVNGDDVESLLEAVFVVLPSWVDSINLSNYIKVPYRVEGSVIIFDDNDTDEASVDDLTAKVIEPKVTFKQGE